MFGRDPIEHPDTPGFNAWLDRQEAQWRREVYPTFFGLILASVIAVAAYEVYSGGELFGIAK